jgi:hypothetical protein
MMEYQSLAIQGQALPVGFNEWLEQGRELYARRKELEWECADWLSTGLDKFPDQMTLALQEFASDPIEQKALVRTARVAAKLPASQRNAALTFAHHAHVADLPVDDRLELLKRAETENLSARALRIKAIEVKARIGMASAPMVPEDFEYYELMSIIHKFNCAQPETRISFVQNMLEAARAEDQKKLQLWIELTNDILDEIQFGIIEA